jgi:AmiR/NasT family two-component response regulator
MDENAQIQKPVQQKSPTELLAAQTQSLSELVEIQNTQKVQIAELKSQNERMIVLLSKQQPVSLGTDEVHVKIENINMPFIALVGFMIKASLASIPAAIILALLVGIVTVVFGGVLTGIFSSFR